MFMNHIPPYVRGTNAVVALIFLSSSKSSTLQSTSKAVSLIGSNFDVFVNSSMIGAENVCLGSLLRIVIGRYKVLREMGSSY